MPGRCCVEQCDDPVCSVCSVDWRIPDQSMIWVDRIGYPAVQRDGKREQSGTRDGAPKLASERPRPGTASKGRRGAAYVPPARALLGDPHE